MIASTLTRRHRLLTCVGAVLTLVSTLAGAQTTTTYYYDAKGRLTAVTRGSTKTSYAYDPADNRMSVMTTGAAVDISASLTKLLDDNPQVIVVPLGGIRTIPISGS